MLDLGRFAAVGQDVASTIRGQARQSDPIPRPIRDHRERDRCRCPASLPSTARLTARLDFQVATYAGLYRLIVPTPVIPLLISAYWAWVLYRTRSRPADWTWPGDASPGFPVSFTRDQFRLVSVVGIVAGLAVAMYFQVMLG